jgi:hypothetical protein
MGPGTEEYVSLAQKLRRLPVKKAEQALSVVMSTLARGRWALLAVMSRMSDLLVHSVRKRLAQAEVEGMDFRRIARAFEIASSEAASAPDRRELESDLATAELDVRRLWTLGSLGISCEERIACVDAERLSEIAVGRSVLKGLLRQGKQIERELAEARELDQMAQALQFFLGSREKLGEFRIGPVEKTRIGLSAIPFEGLRDLASVCGLCRVALRVSLGRGVELSERWLGEDGAPRGVFVDVDLCDVPVRCARSEVRLLIPPATPASVPDKTYGSDAAAVRSMCGGNLQACVGEDLLAGASQRVTPNSPAVEQMWEGVSAVEMGNVESARVWVGRDAERGTAIRATVAIDHSEDEGAVLVGRKAVLKGPSLTGLKAGVEEAVLVGVFCDGGDVCGELERGGQVSVIGGRSGDLEPGVLLQKVGGSEALESYSSRQTRSLWRTYWTHCGLELRALEPALVGMTVTCSPGGAGLSLRGVFNPEGDGVPRELSVNIADNDEGLPGSKQLWVQDGKGLPCSWLTQTEALWRTRVSRSRTFRRRAGVAGGGRVDPRWEGSELGYAAVCLLPGCGREQWDSLCAVMEEGKLRRVRATRGEREGAAETLSALDRVWQGDWRSVWLGSPLARLVARSGADGADGAVARLVEAFAQWISGCDPPGDGSGAV